MGIGTKLGNAFLAVWRDLCGFKNFIKSAFLESDGTTSMARVMMFLFSCFSMWVIWRVFWHVFHLHDTTQLTIWLSNIPLVIAALCGLIVLPYTVNKGSEAMGSVFNGVASVMAAAKQAQTNTALVGTVSGTIQNAQAPAASAPGAVGSSGPKG